MEKEAFWVSHCSQVFLNRLRKKHASFVPLFFFHSFPTAPHQTWSIIEPHHHSILQPTPSMDVEKIEYAGFFFSFFFFCWLIFACASGPEIKGTAEKDAFPSASKFHSVVIVLMYRGERDWWGSIAGRIALCRDPAKLRRVWMPPPRKHFWGRKKGFSTDRRCASLNVKDEV